MIIVTESSFHIYSIYFITDSVIPSAFAASLIISKFPPTILVCKDRSNEKCISATYAALYTNCKLLSTHGN